MRLPAKPAGAVGAAGERCLGRRTRPPRDAGKAADDEEPAALTAES
jgi:hypothetical protein